MCDTCYKAHIGVTRKCVEDQMSDVFNIKAYLEAAKDQPGMLEYYDAPQLTNGIETLE